MKTRRGINDIRTEFNGGGGKMWTTSNPEAAQKRRITRLRNTQHNRLTTRLLKDVSFLGGKS